MHSKVIIASLACVMAASFANGRVSNASNAKAPQLKTQETRCCNAPNEDGINAVLYADKPYQSNDFCLFLQGLEYQSAMASHMDILGRSSGLTVYPLAYNPVYGYYYNVAQPTSDGDYYVTYGAYGKEVATIYIYKSNGVCYGSVLSKFDARAKYYMNEVATSTEQSYYPQSWSGSETLNSTTAINAVKHYGTYVYSGTSDMTMSLSTTQRSGWNDWGSNLSIKVQVEMYKNGTVYPVESARVRLFTSGTEITPGTTKRTGTTGMYTYSMNFMDTFNKTLGNLQIGVFTDCGQGKIKDNYGFDYPYIYTSTSSTQLFNLKTITYKVRVYPERSDRAAAYELSQAAFVPYRYAINYSHSVSGGKILYPAEKTSYFTSFDNYMGISANQLITIKRAHYNAWDVVGHEYGHFICDKLNLSMDPSNDLYWTHGYKEDLIMTYDDWDNGLRMAYSEGLATYFSVAAQLDRASRYPNSYCAAIADEKYVDPINDVDADFNQYKFGVQNGAFGQAVESTVASVLIKLLDDVSRTDDNVALGHTAMWNTIISAGSDTCDIHSFISTLVSQNSLQMQDIYRILDREFVPHPDLPSQAEWTIMIYMCESNLPTDLSINRILDVPGQPSNVNIIIELGGAPNSNLITRYHVRNQQLITDEYFYAQDANSHMGDESTFESFLYWGFANYPANKTGIILLDHGQGINGVCHDPNDWTGVYDAHSDEIYDSLTVSETTTAFNNAFNHFGIDKLEFIGYDACLMQVQDVADFNSDFFKYMVASEEEAVDFMWVYNSWIDCVYDGEGTEIILKEIVDSMVFENSQYQYTWEQTLSVLDLSKMAQYRQKFENLADRIINIVFNDSSLTDTQVWEYYYRVIELASQRAHQYGNQLSTEWPLYGTNDVYDFLNKLLEDDIFGSDYQLRTIVNDLKYFMYPNKIMSSDPNVGEDEAATFGPNARRTLVLYKRSNYVRGGQWACRSHGLAMHVWSEEDQIYPASETRFVKWRQLFFDYRYYQYNEAN